MVLGCLAFLVFLLGARCTNCLSHPRVKACMVQAAGITFTLAGLSIIVAVSWTAQSIIRDFYNPRVPEVLKKEMGVAIYVGWVTSGFLFCGGGVLCTRCPPGGREGRHGSSNRYTLARMPTHTHSSYAIKNYV